MANYTQFGACSFQTKISGTQPPNPDLETLSGNPDPNTPIPNRTPPPHGIPSQVAMRAYVATFNLRGTTQEKRVGSLSGGERGRVHLAKTLRMGCNLLLLDEPTNDLDVDTLRSLEEALGAFAGSAVVVRQPPIHAPKNRAGHGSWSQE